MMSNNLFICDVNKRGHRFERLKKNPLSLLLQQWCPKCGANHLVTNSVGTQIFTRGDNGAGPQSVLNAEALVDWGVSILLEEDMEIYNIRGGYTKSTLLSLGWT